MLLGSKVKLEAGTLNEEWVQVYHGSINHATQIQTFGLDPSRLPTWVMRDHAAAQNAINLAIRADRGQDLGIIEARIPKADFNAVLASSERLYSGFNGALPSSSEIVLRTPEQAALFNRHIVR